MFDVTEPFEFKFVYEQTYFPKVGEGFRNGVNSNLLGNGVARLRVVDSASTDLVMSLAVQYTDLTLDLRMVDGELMRPVICPAGHTKLPCDFKTFVDASRGGVVWRDSPFLDSILPTEVAVDMNSIAVPPESVYARRWQDNSTENESLDRVVERLARHVVIDGIVYRPCKEPTLAIFVDRGSERIMTGWRFEDVTQFSDGVKAVVEPLQSDRRVKVSEITPGLDEVGNFHVTRENDVISFAHAIAMKNGRTVCDNSNYSVTNINENLVSEERDAINIYKYLIKTMNEKNRLIYWHFLHERDISQIEGFVTARKIIEQDGENATLSRICEAMEGAARASDGGVESYLSHDTKHDITQFLGLRWDSVERDRALEKSLAMDDDLSLSVFRI